MAVTAGRPARGAPADGIRPPTPTLSQMVFDGYSAIEANPTSVVFPALAIGFTPLSFSLVGDALRDALDPRMRR